MEPAAPTPDDELAAAAAWNAAGETVAIATVIRAWGSAPRPPGARLVVTASGRMAGSVSGGCVEAEVVSRAAGVLETGAPALLHFDVSNERAWSVGLACGGGLDVFVERLAAP